MKLEEINTDTLLGEQDSFHFFLPLEKARADKDGRRIIQGIASTEARDLQGEVVLQRGIDYSYFDKFGYINDDHKDGPKFKVGEPLECKHTKDGFWIKAFLYKGKERAEHWWEHICALEREQSKRRVGFSIQGKILRRAGKTILKCWLQDVAITAAPVNTNTWAEIVKSLGAQQWCLNPDDDKCAKCGGCDLSNEKALSTLSGSAMMPESLEGSAKVQTYKSLVGRISYEQAVAYLRHERNYSDLVAKAVADAIFTTHGIH
jgi:hypothetical protein